MKVKVTAEDIKNGQRKKPNRCPIAIALNRTCGRIGALVGVTTWQWINEGFDNRSEYFDLPKEARDFIFLFDSGDEVQPREFDL